MELLKESVNTGFNTDAISKGALIYAKSDWWSEEKVGVVSSVTSKLIRVLYHPRTANVTSFFSIPVDEVIKGRWEIRWSYDLEEIWKYSPEEDDNDGEETESGVDSPEDAE